MVIKAQPDDTLTCGGLPLAEDGAGDQTGDDGQMHGCLIGKRYVNQEESIEVLCVKSGEGSLYCNGEELMTKDTKKLPSSD